MIKYSADITIYMIKNILWQLFFVALFFINIYIAYEKNTEQLNNIQTEYMHIAILLILGSILSIPILAKYQINKAISVELTENDITVTSGSEIFSLKWEEIIEIKYRPIFKRLWSFHGKENYEIYIPRWNFSKLDNNKIYNHIMEKSKELNITVTGIRSA